MPDAYEQLEFKFRSTTEGLPVNKRIRRMVLVGTLSFDETGGGRLIFSPEGGASSGSVDWEDILSKPETFPPEAHNHNGVYQPAGEYASAGHDHDDAYQPVGDYAALAHSHEGEYQPAGSYAATVHYHDESYQPLGNYALASHSHDESYQPLGSYALSSHNHAGVYQPAGSYSLTSHNHDGVYQPAGSYAASSHNHDGVYQPAGSYAASSHNHDGVYQPAGSYATASHNHAGVYQPASSVLDATTASFTTALESKLGGIAAGATVGATWGSNVSGQPAVVGQAEAEAGTATTERIWTAQRIAQAIAALAPGGSGAAVVRSARLTAQRTTTANTFSDVTDLSISIGAGETWSFEAALTCGCNNTGGGQFTVTVPSGATLRLMVQGNTSSATAWTGASITASGGNTVNMITANAQNRLAFLSGTVVNGANAGTIQVRFRAITSGQTVTVDAGSYITGRKH